MNKITRGIRFEPLLIARCEAKASAEQLSFSEWLRQIARREVGLTNESARRREVGGVTTHRRRT